MITIMVWREARSLILATCILIPLFCFDGVTSYTTISRPVPKYSRLRLSSKDIDTSYSLSSSAPSSYLATCIPGLAPCLAKELEGIHPDITDIALSGNAAVTFTATREASLNVLCWTRTSHRLLEMVAASSPEDLLYDRNDIHSFIKQEVEVKDLLGDGKGGLLTLSVKTILNNPTQLPKDLSHTHYTALSIKNALCDVVRDLRGDRPDVDIDDPDVPLVAMLRGDRGGASISLYRSLHPPGSLHKRGYRQGKAIHKAAMKESLAAGLLIEANWMEKVEQVRSNPSSKLCLIDPMAGSGSLVLEAAMMAADIAPGLMRIRCQIPGQNVPPVTRWKSELDSLKLWKEILLDASKRAKDGLAWMRSDEPLILRANDIHPGAIEILEESAEAAGLLNLIDVSNMDCYDMEITDDDMENASCLVVTNPPWGVRLTEDIESSWDGLRHFLRDVCPDNTEAWILSGHKAATASLRLRRNKMVPIRTGEQDLRWIQYIISSNEEERKASNKRQQKVPSSPDEEDSW